MRSRRRATLENGWCCTLVEVDDDEDDDEQSDSKESSAHKHEETGAARSDATGEGFGQNGAESYTGVKRAFYNSIRKGGKGIALIAAATAAAATATCGCWTAGFQRASVGGYRRSS